MKCKKLSVYSVLIILVLGSCVFATSAVSCSIEEGMRRESDEQMSGKENYPSAQVSKCKEEDSWTLIHDGRGHNTYPDLREYVWETDRSPYGPADKIALRRLVKADIDPQGVVFICPGTWGNAESIISNPPESLWLMYENYSIAPYLANRDFDIYSIDYRTHYVNPYLEPASLSFMADWGWDVWISDIKKAMDLTKEISGAKKIYMAGESFGGIATMNYASKYWEEDLKGIILLDGGTGGKNPEGVSNTFNLPVILAGMIATGQWTNEMGAPNVGALFLYQYADQYPYGPAINPLTGLPLEPLINPLTGLPWANVKEYATYMLYYAWGPGVVSNIYGGYGDPAIMIHVLAESDRYWSSRLSLESAAIADWDGCPYISYDFDDHYSEIDIPLIGFLSGLFGVNAFGTFRHGIANPDFTGIYLPGYGHLDVYSGEYSEEDVSEPTYEWLINHVMLEGYGLMCISGDLVFGKAVMYINENVIELKVDGVRVSWNIVCRYSRKKLDIYKGENDLSSIRVSVNSKGISWGRGRKIFFIGCLV